MDMQDREELLKRDGLLIAIAGLSLLNGMQFSPWFDIAFLLLQPFAPGFFITSPLVLLYLTSLLLATATLILGGVPAALYERFTGRTTSDATSLAIWAGCCGLLSLPSLLGLLGFLR